MKTESLHSDVLLHITSAIWGFAFVAQLKGRGAFYPSRTGGGGCLFCQRFPATGRPKFTAAGRAEFITGLYVVFVPLRGSFSEKNRDSNLIGAMLAAVGLYFFTSTG